MQEIDNAEDRAHAGKGIDAFARSYGAKVPKAFSTPVHAGAEFENGVLAERPETVAA